MKLRIVHVLTFCILLVFSSSAVFSASSLPDKTVLEAVAHGNMAFAVDLYQRLCQKEGDLFFSPFSISSALAMTRAGACASTASQMDAVLYFTGLPEQQALHETFAAFLKTLNTSQEGLSLAISNSLWGHKNYAFLPAFLSQLEQAYGARLERVDFHAAAEARKQINDWVAKQTKDLIKDLLPDGIITPLTRLILVNAIYFKGMWEAAFDKDDTRDLPFYLRNGKAVRTPIMNRTGSYSYAEATDLQILEIPYKGGKVAMTIFLPAKPDGLAALENGLTADLLQQHVQSLSRVEKVNVYLPRFKSTGSFSLSETLKALGMTEAFSLEKADFSGMTEKRELAISEVVHKAFVDVSEEGTEAAAATAVVMQLRCAAPMEKKIPVFRADRPFLYVIRDLTHGNLLFMGRFARPAGEEIDPSTLKEQSSPAVIQTGSDLVPAPAPPAPTPDDTNRE
ncbi:MAG TPA: serpin family protein [Candidatus Ozemobacteraceae bacterium]|nr:serpin family protein [Candidatus Ozemobacteraceae bacterium]